MLVPVIFQVNTFGAIIILQLRAHLMQTVKLMHILTHVLYAAELIIANSSQIVLVEPTNITVGCSHDSQMTLSYYITNTIFDISELQNCLCMYDTVLVTMSCGYGQTFIGGWLHNMFMNDKTRYQYFICAKLSSLDCKLNCK